VAKNRESTGNPDLEVFPNPTPQLGQITAFLLTSLPHSWQYI